MAILYEYHNKITVPDPKGLRDYLHTFWQEQSFPGEISEEESDEITRQQQYQPFLIFDGHESRARNYVGFIQWNEFHLEIYPKVFRSYPVGPLLMIRHLFFWFDHCRKWKFPFTRSKLDTLENLSLPELIIYLMASKMLDTASSMPVSMYQSVEESLYSPKGRISFDKYLSTGFLNGNQHRIDCEYEPLVYDNRLNRIIKYTGRLLLGKTRIPENRRILEELLFVLDEVEDHPSHYTALDTIMVNPLFVEYEGIKDICRIVLQQMMYGNQQYDLSQWSLLFPMEYIFEDFICGFLEDKFSDTWKVEYQKSNLNLSSTPEAFRMQHDIFLTLKADSSVKIIVDTKYKLREKDFQTDKKKGVSQADMYQVISYAMRRGVHKVVLLYPNIESLPKQPDSFVVQSSFPGGDRITILAAEVPFWSIDDLEGLAARLEKALKEVLESCKSCHTTLQPKCSCMRLTQFSPDSL
jgi:5-methylcytosine-specific restriction enzyme subunit McrC